MENMYGYTHGKPEKGGEQHENSANGRNRSRGAAAEQGLDLSQGVQAARDELGTSISRQLPDARAGSGQKTRHEHCGQS